MPTGYTAKIVDGEMTEFDDFAKSCVRNFGAAMHMKDESIDVKYTPKNVDANYYEKSINKSLKELKELNSKTDEEIIEDELKSMVENRIYHLEQAQKDIKVAERLIVFLNKARAWKPPTQEHINFKNFMIEQLQTTIDHDGNPDYHIRAIDEIDKRLAEGIDAEEHRRTQIECINKDIARSQERTWNEINNTYSSNKWVIDLVNTLNENKWEL